MQRIVLLSLLTLASACGAESASCNDSFVDGLPDLFRIVRPASDVVVPGTTLEVDAVVDDSTRFVSIQFRSVDDDEVFGSGSVPSSSTDGETVGVSVVIDNNTLAGTYYLAADVCAAADCPTGEAQTSYRLGTDANTLAKTRILGADAETFTSCVLVYRLNVE